ncbi:hypothetical protein [Methylocystis parvus]|uniref:hypothetical protein n=1 Tax=Methylocystis parvus TaxID=134 RepID=UPI003C79042A
MLNFATFSDATRKALASYLGSRTMRDIVVAYLIVLGALVFAICDAQALAPKTTIHTFQGGIDGGFTM